VRWLTPYWVQRTALMGKQVTSRSNHQQLSRSGWPISCRRQCGMANTRMLLLIGLRCELRATFHLVHGNTKATQAVLVLIVPTGLLKRSRQ